MMHVHDSTSAIFCPCIFTNLMTAMPIDSPHLFKPHEPSQDWRRLSDWKAPTKIPPPPPASSAVSVAPLHHQYQGTGRSTAISTQSSSVLATALRDSTSSAAQATRPPPSPRRRSSTHAAHRSRSHKLKSKSKLITQSTVRVIPVNGKGQGVFATKPIEAGTIILRERPFIVFQDPLTSLEVYTALSALSPDSRDIF
jgi:hypothetical protein